MSEQVCVWCVCVLCVCVLCVCVCVWCVCVCVPVSVSGVSLTGTLAGCSRCYIWWATEVTACGISAWPATGNQLYFSQTANQ